METDKIKENLNDKVSLGWKLNGWDHRVTCVIESVEKDHFFILIADELKVRIKNKWAYEIKKVI